MPHITPAEGGPSGPRDEQARHDGEPKPGRSVPVVLVHGMLGQEILYWNFLRRRLAANGLQAHEISLPSLALGDLRQAALSFRRDLYAFLERSGDPAVDVIAHSAGGLVMRYFVKRLADGAPVRRLVTLGTPHQGTRTARLFPEVGMIGQVRQGSDFLADLNEGDPTPGPTCYTAFWTPFDGVVTPAASARLPAAPNVENICYPGLTHWGYLFGPRVARVLVQELRAGFQGGERTVGKVPATV